MKIKSTYNNVFRAFMGLNRDSSMSKSYVDHNVHSFNGMLFVIAFS